MREKTHAHRNYVDDVPDEIKQRRLTELIQAFRESTGQCFDSQIGTVQLVLVEGPNKRAPDTELIGKSDRGHRVSFPILPVPDQVDNDGKRNPKVGDYVEVRILKSTRASLFGEALGWCLYRRKRNKEERENKSGIPRGSSGEESCTEMIDDRLWLGGCFNGGGEGSFHGVVVSLLSLCWWCLDVLGDRCIIAMVKFRQW
ncbi:unnamed protein product [Ilex paraguariensis]|uniref:TRAM domain-containing protein n=1 Tax=Ilex paraguariensis TaxID=185542 RepID=A0ABC8T2E1_9AQUA